LRQPDGSYLPPLLSPTLRYSSPGVYPIEPDATAASYFLTLPVVTHGTVYLPAMSAPGAGLQGDTRFMDVLKRLGAAVVARKSASGRTEGVEVRFANPTRPGVDQNFSEFSDTFLTLAAIAPLLDGPTRITGIAHTRKQETDRVAGMARELTKLGQNVAETEDSLTITPQPLRPGQTIETYGDHRFAMSFGILGCHDLHGDGRPWLTIKHPACCAKTFPHFFELLETLRKKTLGN
jgi:3-phosphoshikimate 1-carboxyvinyltransferase